MSKEIKIEPALHVLIVDDDRDDLAMVVNAFRSLSEGHWQVHTATGMGEALQHIKPGKIQLLVLAVNSPVSDVSLWLSSLGQPPTHLKRVVMAATPTAENRAASLAAGADLFIEKPVSPEGLKVVFVDLSKLTGWALPPSVLSGSPGVSVADLIQMECLARNSSILELFHEQSLGRIYIEEGQLIHAVCGELAGERALNKLFTLTGTFELHDFEPPPERTLNRTWEVLLGEATRQRDSLNARTPSGSAAASDAEALATNPAGQAAEMLICSGTGEVLYHWQCPTVAARLTLLQAVLVRAEKLIPEIQLGKLDRLEIQLTAGRAVLQPRADRLIFVRLGSEKP